ncbi:gfo/Idh/MocA family oxidoreductase [Chitinophaga sp. SYP-B3965]|uniref:Gfo/Idh/MocA family protein n=1 Tax=Chitinophaga sp. SYP-B3965 TaxID=2663120 RepID=UPI0012996F16|nr:Gfo/Idh/MocA family oxidoreductase [Chitinophaga sp. SYP-B3965]MRG45047.1 gfo/Idh/MocA family oxidoreductase [Chitinophaga sp. SYP-B3965]
MHKTEFGFGIVGAGAISGIHAKAIAAIGGAKLTGIYSINRHKSVTFAEEHPCKVFDTLEEMVNDPAIDIVCICTPSGLHMEPALKAIEAGKHCLIEKPLEITLERCDAIIEAAEKAGVVVAVVFPSRFHEASRLIREAMDAGRCGPIVFGDVDVKWSRSEAYYQSAQWRGTWQFDGGGALMNQGIHSVDLLQWYMGPVEAVQAMTANRRHKEIEVEDTVTAIIRFASGALGTIECSTAAYPGALKRLEITGTAGTIIMEESSLLKWELADETAEDQRIRNAINGEHASTGGAADPMAISYAGHQYQMEDLIRAISTGSKPLVDALEGRKSVEIVRAIYKSAETGELVKLPL